MRVLHVVTVGTSIVRNAASLASKCTVLEKWRDKLSCWATVVADSEKDVQVGNSANSSSEVS